MSWAPQGWALCNGAQVPISQNPGLNALLGQTYGGNRTTQFALPALRGRTPIRMGIDPDGLVYQQGKACGSETAALTAASTPRHSHTVNALGGTLGNVALPKSAISATVGIPANASASVNIYAVATDGPQVQLNQDGSAPRAAARRTSTFSRSGC